jgi:sporulation protein YlmC with PRC-barrel domain
MKRLGTVIVALSLLSVPLGTVAFWAERETLVEADTVVGSPGSNTEGKDMGRVKNLLINLKDGKIAYTVVTRGRRFQRSSRAKWFQSTRGRGR